MKKFFLLLSVFFLFSCSQETIKYTLTTSVNPADAGTVNPETRQYNEGDTATLIATPAAEYVATAVSLVCDTVRVPETPSVGNTIVTLEVPPVVNGAVAETSLIT